MSTAVKQYRELYFVLVIVQKCFSKSLRWKLLMRSNKFILLKTSHLETVISQHLHQRVLYIGNCLVWILYLIDENRGVDVISDIPQQKRYAFYKHNTTSRVITEIILNTYPAYQSNNQSGRSTGLCRCVPGRNIWPSACFSVASLWARAPLWCRLFCLREEKHEGVLRTSV